MTFLDIILTCNILFFFSTVKPHARTLIHVRQPTNKKNMGGTKQILKRHDIEVVKQYNLKDRHANISDIHEEIVMT